MSYIGASPTTAAFPFDQFSGNGSTTAFTMSYAPASTTSIVVSISGVVQNPNTYSVSGLTLTFSPAPPTGTNNIGVLYLGLPASGVTTPGNTAYLSTTSFTATAAQTTFTPSGTYQVGFINVIRNGSQLAPADYTATNGTTVVLNNACVAGDIVVIEVYNLTSVTNALPLTGGTVTGATTFNSTLVIGGNVGVGTTSPSNKLDIVGTGSSQIRVKDGVNATAYYDFGRDGTDGFFGFSGAQTTFSGYKWSINAGTEAMRITNAGLFQFNSGYGSVATAYGCRAWVNFNGTGTVSITGSGNVSSITDNGVGLYTINFTTAMPDTAFSAGAIPASDARYVAYVSRTTSTLGVSVANGSLTRYDVDPIMVQVFR